MNIWAHQLGFWCKNNRNEIHCIVNSLRDPYHIVCAPILEHSYILCKTTGALFYLKSVTDHIILACLTSESSMFHEQHVCEMCHMSLRHWQTFPAFSLFFILPFSPSGHKYDIGHVKLSLHSLHYIKTFIHSIHNKGTCNTFTSVVELSNIEYK
jgi:hypothetical protein